MSAAEERGRVILAALDGTPVAGAALRVARGMADLLGGTLHVVHVTPGRLSPKEVRRRLALGDEELLGAVIESEEGEPAEATARLARKARPSLVVIGRRAQRPPEEGALGAMAEGILAATAAPLVLVPPSPGTGPYSVRRALLPQDGTPAMAAAIGPAAHLASCAGAELTVLYVAARGGPPQERGAMSAPRYVDQPQHEWPEWVREFLARTACGCPDLDPARLRFVMAHGDPGEEILRHVRDLRIDLVALGWKGSLAPARARVLRRVVAESPCPVLVARAAEEGGRARA
ncbi:universal stress protein [Myxococcota bacterium]|nr:universal stress protein [Myxococcota bacterium]